MPTTTASAPAASAFSTSSRSATPPAVHTGKSAPSAARTRSVSSSAGVVPRTCPPASMPWAMTPSAPAARRLRLPRQTRTDGSTRARLAPRLPPERHDRVRFAGRHPVGLSGKRQQQVHHERSRVRGLAVGGHLRAHLCGRSKADLAHAAGAADGDGQGRLRQPTAHTRADHRHRDAEALEQAHTSDSRSNPPRLALLPDRSSGVAAWVAEIRSFVSLGVPALRARVATGQARLANSGFFLIHSSIAAVSGAETSSGGGPVGGASGQ